MLTYSKISILLFKKNPAQCTSTCHSIFAQSVVSYCKRKVWLCILFTVFGGKQLPLNQEFR